VEEQSEQTAPEDSSKEVNQLEDGLNKLNVTKEQSEDKTAEKSVELLSMEKPFVQLE
jgi:hypothetical protein